MSLDHGAGAAAGLHGSMVLGPYTLERQLGQGGMGEVWLAQRADGRFQGQVAIKTLHPYLARAEVRGRFRREGQIVARLSHQNIARLYDAGVSADGLLYLVFEYVQGERIDAWCDRRTLDISARVKLFLGVCEAVSHAHTHLIVHRDLKPSNIMVGGDGQVKLLDFGIAKLIEDGAEAGIQTELTRLGGRALTLEYAAPEQVLGTAVTTVTDVYALGVLLYLLLSGSRPYAGKLSTTAQLEYSVVEAAPLPLAAAAVAAAAADDSSPQERAARRGTTPGRLRKTLNGDLENILNRALRKQPEQRYASVASLADDLRRYLLHQPVRARPDAFAYRAAKFLRRHRAGVAAAALLVLAISAGLGGVAWQARVARAQALRAERVKNLVVSVFREHDPLDRSGKDPITPKQMIGEAISQADEELRGDPGLHAELLDDLGEIQFNLGNIAGSILTLRRAADENQALYGADSAQLAASLRRQAGPLDALNQHDDEKQVEEQALAILLRLGQGESLEAARVKQRLAVALAWGKGAPPRSLALAADAERIFEARLGPDDPEALHALYLRASLEEQARRDPQAEALLREDIARYEKRYGPDTVRLAQPLCSLARVLTRNDKGQEAEALLQRAISLTRGALGPRHQFLVSALLSLGSLYAGLGQLQQAESTFLEVQAALPQDDDADRIEQLRELGQVHVVMGRADEAEGELRQAFEMIRKNNGEARGFTWFVGSEWGRALAAQGKLKEAETIQRESLDRLGKIMGEDAYQNCLIADALADTLEKKGGSREEVTRLRRRSLALTEKSYPRTSTLWAERASNLARALLAADSDAARAEAAPLLDQAVTDYRASPSPRDKSGATLLLRGRIEAAAGQTDAARADLTEAVGRLQQMSVPDPLALEQARALLRRMGPA